MSNTYTASSATKANLLSTFHSVIDGHAGWTSASDASDYIFTNVANDNLKFKIAYTASAGTISFSMHDGTSYSKSATMTFSNNTDAQSVSMYNIVNDNRIITVLSTQNGDGTYTNNVSYLGYIGKFDSNDKHAWGMYVSGASELEGKGLTRYGIPYGCLETFWMRAVTKRSDSSDNPISIDTSRYAYRTTTPTPYIFADMQGWGGEEYGYNSEGVIGNLECGTATFGSFNLRDLAEEEKFISKRATRIGVFKEFDGNDGRGLRGVLDGMYHLGQTWYKDSAGLVVPRTKGSIPTSVKLLVGGSRGAGFLDSGITNWLVVPLSNKVKNYDIYNGLNVIVIPVS
jgi:hypothetical protein